MARDLGIQVTEKEEFYFISYNSEDKDRVADYVKLLDEYGLQMWYDKGLHVGDKWENEISSRIEKCQAVIMFITKGIFEKDKSYVHKEYKIATEFFDKKIYLVYLDEIHNKEIPHRYISWWIDLQTFQAIMATHCESVDDCAKKILSALDFKIEKAYDGNISCPVCKQKKFNLVDNKLICTVCNCQFDLDSKYLLDGFSGESGDYSVPLHVLPDEETPNEYAQKQAEKIIEIFNRKIDLIDVNIGPAIIRLFFSSDSLSNEEFKEKEIDLKKRIDTINFRLVYISGLSKFAVEIPKRDDRITVRLKDVLSSADFKKSKKGLICALGKDVFDKPLFADICKMPHLLIGGSAGMGKTSLIHTVLVSLMINYSPDELRFILISPKVTEYNSFLGSPHLLFNEIIQFGVKTDATLSWIKRELESRYTLFDQQYVRNIDEYNELKIKQNQTPLCKYVVVIDEFSDFVSNLGMSMTCDLNIIVQKARMAGIYMIVTTSILAPNVLDGMIRANFSSRITFKTESYFESIQIMNEKGAENLFFEGDMLYRFADMPSMERALSAYTDESDIKAVVRYVAKNYPSHFEDNVLKRINALLINRYVKETEEAVDIFETDRENCLKVLSYAIDEGRITASKIQRKFSMGFNRASRILTWMMSEGYVNMEDKGARVLITREEFNEKFGNKE